MRLRSSPGRLERRQSVCGAGACVLVGEVADDANATFAVVVVVRVDGSILLVPLYAAAELIAGQRGRGGVVEN